MQNIFVLFITKSRNTFDWFRLNGIDTFCEYRIDRFSLAPVNQFKPRWHNCITLPRKKNRIVMPSWRCSLPGYSLINNSNEDVAGARSRGRRKSNIIFYFLAAAREPPLPRATVYFV